MHPVGLGVGFKVGIEVCSVDTGACLVIAVDGVLLGTVFCTLGGLTAF